MVDGILMFLLVGVVNGVVYRFFFKPQTALFPGGTGPDVGAPRSQTGSISPVPPASQPEVAKSDSSAEAQIPSPPVDPELPGSGSESKPQSSD